MTPFDLVTMGRVGVDLHPEQTGVPLEEDDGFGRFARAALAGFDVDSRWVGTHPRLRTPLAFCEIHPPAVVTTRLGCAGDMPAQAEVEALAGARVTG